MQGIAGQAGMDWKAVASANNIDNPRLLDAGAVLNLNVG
ncbi:MAG: LysM peptidoglycan-binding domain-containing protein [Anaerolineae bacterium]|nr:LysM peptidoglycan-binding domain-containing protein [Anaerolineae bacterium]